MSYRVQLTPRAHKYLKSLQRKIARRIIVKLETLADNPRPHGCRKIKTGRERFRIRAGNYRIIYEVRDKVLLVLVVRIGHRQDIYDKHQRDSR